MRGVEVPDWLKGLPLAPEYRPTDTEFEDPIAYISKIEKEASVFGICKIVPPLPKPSRKYVISNLNKSLAKRPELGPAARPQDACSTSSAVFTTRQQELGQNGKSAKKAVRKQVWQSGEVYTLEQFEAKAKAFARGHLRDVKAVSSLAIETLFWEAACEKPIYIEYANDVPGSGFGEPVGSYRRLNSRRRRRTTFRRNCGGSCADNSTLNTPETVPKPTVLSNIESKRSDSGNEVDGSSGWKLSNSSWNLQVIARSLGSLTRFMADDIPGVTSPMVYIGMLFSWFAWHVEDHELHSLNFLHTGSPKTWYAVPGDHAFSFEEVVRRQAYGADVDRLASLTKLGEKTTLLSPEAIVDSGIPCCRLVQNPGEFVVTFPRAYHVGFSHGFNCGEAANFGTLKWLEVAKDAAVRRAAMNYLPMLSHQQLLYLLTMSFVSRIPRELLPGSRSSRLRDRQKDERELSVKKAFLDDILSENKLLTTVLRRSCSNRVVLWDLESLPSFAKLPERCSLNNTIIAPEDNVVSENKNNQDLFRDMNLYMENVNDLYMDNDDLSGDFQLYSGSLACVACGVLGFPFMSVVQPSERASVNLLEDVGVVKHDLVSDGAREDIELCRSNSLHYSNGEFSSGMPIKSMTDSSVNLFTSHYPLEVQKVTPEPQVEKGWCSTKGFLRPRIFCLEHAVQIRDLLHSKGGANILVICHSDFKKMEANAAVIKEQIGSPFRYKEVPLDSATQGDLNLIDLAIDDEEHDECGKDWTSKLSINLRHCVKTRKSSMCKLDQHALALGGLFSDTDSCSNTFGFKWPFRKSRSERRSLKNSSEHNMEKPGLGNLIESMGRENGQLLVVNSSTENIRNEREVIQYSRRKSKCKAGNSMVKTTLTKQVHNEASVSDSGDQYLKNLVNTADTGKESSGLSISASNGNCGSQFSAVVSVSSQAACSVTPGAKNAEASTGDDFEMQLETEADRSNENIVTISAETSACSVVVAAEDPQHLTNHGENKSSFDVSVADAGSVDPAPSCCSDSVTAISAAQREEREVEKLSENVERGDCGEEEDIQGMNEDTKELVPGDETLFDRSSVISKDAGVEVPMTSAVKEMRSDGYHSSPDNGELENDGLTMVMQKSHAKNKRKRRRELDLQVHNPYGFDGFIRSPCESLRPRSSKHAKIGEIVGENAVKEKPASKSTKLSSSTLSRKDKKENEKRSHMHGKENQVVKEKPKLKKLTNPSNSSLSGKDKEEDEKGSLRRDIENQKVKEKTPSKKLTNPSNSSLSGKDKEEDEKGSLRRDIENQKVKEKPPSKKLTNPSNSAPSRKDKKEREKKKRSLRCDIEKCPMRFNTKEALNLHKSFQCPHKGCGKSFSSHTNTVRHQRVHDKDRPLKCQWKGCDKSFKWEWSRVEHTRLHTGERPYSCTIKGCGLTFRFISDFSRHRRKTGHYVTPST